MKRSGFSSLLHRLAEEAIPPAEVDLWPAVRSRFETRKAQRKGDFFMNQSFAQHRRLVYAAISVLAVLLVAALLLLTPQGRAWARSALQFFTRSANETILAPTSEPLVWVEQTPGVPAPTMTPLPPMAPFAAECGDYRQPSCSIEQIRNKVNFTVKELATLPAGMYFVGATGGPEEAYILYDTFDHSRGLMLFEQPWTGSPEQKAFEIAPGIEVATVQIGSLTGEYVQGSYGYKSGETVETWNTNNGLENLRWTDQGVYYKIMYVGMGGTPLGKEELGALAANMTTQAVSANLPAIPATATPEPTLDPDRWDARYPLTPAQASEKAGFKVLVPPKMPGNLSFIGAQYEAEYQWVVLFYLLNCGDCDNSLRVLEQPVSGGEECLLCGYKNGDYATADANPWYGIVGEDAIIETVQIGDGTGQYVQGEWDLNNGNPVWTNIFPTQHLRWQKDGMAFEILDWSWDLSKADVIAIAESMR